jgi:GNAT superfamily N-acetyltransferase
MTSKTAAARRATIEDLDFVSQDGYLPPEILERKIAQGECFLVEEGCQPVGYLRLEYLWSLIPYIALIHIQEQRRKQGFSRVLLAFVIDTLREKGHNCLYSSSQVDEPTPQAWHRHIGFKECGVLCGVNDGGVGEIFFRLTF